MEINKIKTKETTYKRSMKISIVLWKDKKDGYMFNQSNQEKREDQNKIRNERR